MTDKTERNQLLASITSLKLALAAETARADALVVYAKHHGWCKTRLRDKCDCGLTQFSPQKKEIDYGPNEY